MLAGRRGHSTLACLGLARARPCLMQPQRRAVLASQQLAYEYSSLLHTRMAWLAWSFGAKLWRIRVVVPCIHVRLRCSSTYPARYSAPGMVSGVPHGMLLGMICAQASRLRCQGGLDTVRSARPVYEPMRTPMMAVRGGRLLSDIECIDYDCTYSPL